MAIKPKERKLIKLQEPFSDVNSYLALVELLNYVRYTTMILYIKFEGNFSFLAISNNLVKTATLSPSKCFLSFLQIK